MALQGDLTIYWQEPHPTEIKISEIKYPDADKMDPEDPNIEKAGTTEEVQEPVMLDKEKTFENVYVVIRTYALMKIESHDNLYDSNNEPFDTIVYKSWNLNLRYTVYESKEAKEKDVENYLYENFTSHELLDESLELTNLGYSKLKQIKGFEKLTDVI